MPRRLGRFNFEVGLRAALLMAVPLFTLLALGRLDLAPYAICGAFTALYGRNEPYRLRFRSVSIAGLALVSCIALGISAALVGEPLWLVTVLLVIVVSCGVMMTAIWDLMPAQPLFLVFGLVVCAHIPTRLADVPVRLSVALGAATLCVLITMSGWLLRHILLRWNVQPETNAILIKKLYRIPSVDTAAFLDARVWMTVIQNSVAVCVAGGLALSLGLGHPYWAVITVVAALPPARAAHSLSRSLHRTVGTVAGVVIAFLFLTWSPPLVVIVSAIVVCQFFAQILIGISYGWSMVFITPLALSVSYLAGGEPLGSLVSDRVIETILGAAVAVVFVLLARGVTRRFFSTDTGASSAR